MGDITGSNAIAGLKAAGTFGTAVTCIAGDQLNGITIHHNENASALQVPPVGSGDIMVNQTDAGNTAPSVTIDGPLGYNTPQVTALAQLLGTNNVMGLGSGGYIHSLLVNETANQAFMTVAWQAHSAGTFEYPSCVTTRATINFPAPKDYITSSFELLGNEQKLTSATNTWTSLNSVTAADLKRMVWDFTDDFQINAQAGGALSSSDRVNIASATIEFQRPQEHPREAKGSAGNGQPIATGEYPFIATVTVNLRRLSDFTFFTAHQAGTEYKAKFTKTGPLIGGAVYYGMTVDFPRLKIVQSPDSNLAEAGNNPVTIVFQAMVASAAPTGMIDKYPVVFIKNTRQTSFLV